MNALTADVGDEDQRLRAREAVDVEDVAADGQVIRRRDVRAADLAVRQRHRLAPERLLQYLGDRALLFELSVEARAVCGEQNCEHAEAEHPEGAQIRGTVELRLQALEQRRSLAGQRHANRGDRPRLVVGEEFVALVELDEAVARIAQDRRGDLGAPLRLQLPVAVE